MIRASNTPRQSWKMQTEAKPNPVSPEARERKHESRNPPAGWIVAVAGMVVLMIMTGLIVSWLMAREWVKTRPLDRSILERGTIVAAGVEPLARFPRPNLQLNPHEDLLALRAREDEELTNYGWIDRKAGVVRIPIKRAMELIAERGLPTRSTNEPAHTGKSEFELARERQSQK